MRQTLVSYSLANFTHLSEIGGADAALRRHVATDATTDTANRSTYLHRWRALWALVVL